MLTKCYKPRSFVLTTLLLIATGCAEKNVLGYSSEPTTSEYTEPKESGLETIHPYPTAEDVCRTLSDNTATRDLRAGNVVLIACPKHEKGAIGDRISEGATVVAHARHWSILSVPN